ncbi:MAG TPA: LPS export ABC transporter periplasmic protein LptC, partial [Nitrospirae bacterium]|nr:LPS export ABC transporter periplasmic protein LptC [Nitrospirota bacterium]
MIKNKSFQILSAILVFGILILLGYNERNVKILPSYRTSSMKNFHLTHKEGSEVKWELSADKAVLPIGNKEVFLESLSLKINRTPEIFLTSGSGIYEIDKGNITLNKNVELNIKETTFTADTMKYNSKDEIITTDDKIKFNGDNFLIE